MTTPSPVKLKVAPIGSPGVARPSSPRSERVSVSWLNGRIDLGARTGDAIQVWSGPETVSSVEQLAEMLARCRKQIGWGPGDATLILSHAALGSLLLEVPAASPTVLRRIVEREVERQKTFAGPAAWCETPVILPERGRVHSVHFLDQELLDRLVAVFGAVGLRLTLVTPASEFLRTLAGVDSPRMEGTFLASAVIPGGLLFSMNYQGCGVLQRQVPVGSTESNHWGMELKRTLVYARQHLRVALEDVRLIGAESDLGAVSGGDLPPDIATQRIPLAASEWNRWWLEHAGLTVVNLIGSSRRNRVQRPRLYRLGRTLAWMILGVALVLGFNVERMVRVEGEARQRLNGDVARHREELQRAREAEEQRRQESEIIQRWNEYDRPPVYLWLPRALEVKLPSTLVLTQVVLRPTAGSWAVTIAGIGSPEPAALDTGSVERFRRSLAEGTIPMRAVSDQSLETSTAGVSGEESGHWSQRLVGAPRDQRARPQRFQLEAQIP